MISGFINTSLEAIIRPVVYGMNGQEHEVEAVIDTGFTGFLTLPSALIASLGLIYGHESRIRAVEGGAVTIEALS